jgi:hypothetical protein
METMTDGDRRTVHLEPTVYCPPPRVERCLAAMRATSGTAEVRE